MARKSDIFDQDSVLQSYFSQIRDIPLLTFEEELELSRQIENGNEAAKKRLIEANLKLVIRIAKLYAAADISLMDIIQEGNLGLMTAAEKYSHTKNVRFSTYAGWWIRQAITRFLSNKRRAIKLPQRKEETLRRIHRVYHTLTQTLKRQPRYIEIAEEIGTSRDEVEFLLNMTSGFMPVEMEGLSEETGSVANVYEDYTYSPEQVLMRKSTRAAAYKALKVLNASERRVLLTRFQFLGNERQTFKSIGKKMGISPETVRQIEMRAIEKMRDISNELPPFFVEAI